MRVDWRAYFREFSLVHGGEPVLYLRNPEVKRSGYLLFPDGWKYSSWNVAGPEYPPPTDRAKHLKLIKDYWTIRRQTLQLEYAKLKDDIESLARAQQHRSARLQIPEMVTVEDEDGHRSRNRQMVSVDFGLLLGRLRELKLLLDTCDQKIEHCEIPEYVGEKFQPAGILTELEVIDKGVMG